MRRLYRPLLAFWIVFVLGVVVYPLLRSYLSGCLLEGKNCVPPQAVLDVLLPYVPLIVLALMGLGALTLISWRDHSLQENFELLKPANKLRPEDLNFQVRKRGDLPTTP